MFKQLLKEIERIVTQYVIIAGIFGVGYAVHFFASDKWGGTIALGIIGSAIGGFAGTYIRKIVRYTANVRFRKGRLQRTGDGGEDYWTALVRKEMPSPITRPFDHFVRPFPGTEITVDVHGAGSVRHNKRPMTVIGAHEKFIVSVGHADKTATPPGELYKVLRDRGKKAVINIKRFWENGEYTDLPEDARKILSEKEFYILLGLSVLERDGLKIQVIEGK